VEESVDRSSRGLSVRTKVLGSVLVMAALGMATAEAASYVVPSRRLDVRLNASLQQEVSEFRALNDGGVDPATGQGFRGVKELLQTALARNVADETQATSPQVPWTTPPRAPTARTSRRPTRSTHRTPPRPRRRS